MTVENSLVHLFRVVVVEHHERRNLYYFNGLTIHLTFFAASFESWHYFSLSLTQTKTVFLSPYAFGNYSLVMNYSHFGSHWSKNPDLSENSYFEYSNFHKIHILKFSFLTKFTFSKSDFSQNSHF